MIFRSFWVSSDSRQVQASVKLISTSQHNASTIHIPDYAHKNSHRRNSNSALFIAQRCNRVLACSPPRRGDAENKPNSCSNSERQ